MGVTFKASSEVSRELGELGETALVIVSGVSVFAGSVKAEVGKVGEEEGAFFDFKTVKFDVLNRVGCCNFYNILGDEISFVVLEEGEDGEVKVVRGRLRGEGLVDEGFGLGFIDEGGENGEQVEVGGVG